MPFHVTWGSKTGASPKRVLAHVCRRGGVDGQQVGAIKIHDYRSVVDIAEDRAEEFARRVRKPDPRNPKVHIGEIRAAREEAWKAAWRQGREEPKRPPLTQ